MKSLQQSLAKLHKSTGGFGFDSITGEGRK